MFKLKKAKTQINKKKKNNRKVQPTDPKAYEMRKSKKIDFKKRKCSCLCFINALLLDDSSEEKI